MLARQWSLRRSGAAASAEGGLPRVQECFRLHLNAVGSGVAIVQVCVVDHTDGNYRPPHLHLQLLFSDSSRSQWIQLNQVTVPQLQTALAELVVPASQPQPQLHLHEVEPVSHGVELAVQERLPRHELSAAEAALWTQRGRQCPICLADYAAGDVITCLPCPGSHTSHVSCLLPWFETASTCPMCRKNLPAAKDRSLDALMADAARQLAALLVSDAASSCNAAQPVSCHTCEAGEPPKEPPKEGGHAPTEAAGDDAPAAGAGLAAVAARAEAVRSRSAVMALAELSSPDTPAAEAPSAGGEGGEGGEGAAAEAGRSRRFSAGAARRSIVNRVAHVMGGKAR